MKKIGRNDHCSCGSGIKFKKCCLKNQGSLSESNVLYLGKEKNRDILLEKLEGGIEIGSLKAKHFHGDFRQRKTDLPRTFFLFKNESGYFLLFWIEYGIDNSIYVWFDDDPNESWEVVGKHSQEKIKGKHDIEFIPESLNVFDPHITWHPTGQVHVRGYNKLGQKKETVISKKTANDLTFLKQGETIPLTALIFPTMNTEPTLKWFGHKVSDLYQPNTSVAFLDKSGLTVFNDGVEKEAFFVIDSQIIPNNRSLIFDIGMVYGNTPPSLPPLLHFLYPTPILTKKVSSEVSTYLRIGDVETKLKGRASERITATLFNNDSVDLFQMKKQRVGR